MKTLCFTGRRPQKLPWKYNESDERCIKLKLKLEENISAAIAGGVSHFITGMALGVDIWAAEIVINKKLSGSKITLEAAIPHRKQSASWSYEHKKRYDNILKNCDKTTYVCENYSYSCMMMRNKYMVDSSDYVMAVLNDFSGGTGKTVLYARSKGVPINIISI